MPTHTFSSFDAYSAAVQHASLRAIFLGPKRTNWALSYLNMNGLGVQWGQEGGANVSEGTAEPGGVSIFVPSQNGRAISGNGRRFDDTSLMVLIPGDEFCIAAANWNRWFSVTVPNELLADASGSDTAAIGLVSGVIRPRSDCIEKFRSVVEQLGQVVQNAPAAFDSLAVLSTTARKLTETVREALSITRGVTRASGRHSIPRRQIIRMAMDFVDKNAGEYLSVDNLATAAGISERTLRTAFREYFGVGPARYLKRRTLYQARQALKSADPAVATVAEIATRFGVWDFGHFAHDYRALFGELPSDTLRHLR